MQNEVCEVGNSGGVCVLGAVGEVRQVGAVED
jgi:hypothetical protein